MNGIRSAAATRESGEPELLRDDVADGRMVMPADTSILVSLGLPVMIEPLEIFL